MLRKKRNFVPKIGQEVECFNCRSKRGSAWMFPFTGYVTKVYEKSALVVIISTHPTDDSLVVEYKGKTVVSFKELKVVR